MALSVSSCRNSERRKPGNYMERRTFMLLKDYLLDDLSSCSSNGFKSFPRRQQCCPSSVRLLLEIDLKKPTPTTKHAERHKHNTKTTTISSALHRASAAVINAVRSIKPFHSSASSVKSPLVKAFLPRSLSSRLFRRRQFWRKNIEYNHDVISEVKEIKRWRSFGELLGKEKEEEEGESKPSDSVGAKTTSFGSAVVTITSKGSSSPRSTNYSDSCTESEFTTSSTENDAAEVVAVNEKVSDDAGVTVGEESSVTTTTTCSSVDNINKVNLITQSN